MRMIEFINLMEISLITSFIIIRSILKWRKSKYEFELQKKLLDKFSSTPELNDFLKSDSENKLKEFLRLGIIAPKERLMASITKAVNFSLVGLAFFFIAFLMVGKGGKIKVVQFFALLFIAVGIGFLVSTFISYKLSKKRDIISATE